MTSGRAMMALGRSSELKVAGKVNLFLFKQWSLNSGGKAIAARTVVRRAILPLEMPTL